MATAKWAKSISMIANVNTVESFIPFDSIRKENVGIDSIYYYTLCFASIESQY